MDCQTSAKVNLSPFYYSQICLMPLTESCLQDTIKWRNFYKEWFNDSNEIVLTKHLQWFERYQQLNNDFVFIVENLEQMKVGQTSLYNIDWEKQTGEFGRIIVNPECAGQGYMKAACLATVDLAASILKLKSLYLNVKPNNLRAINLYKQCGFTIENDVNHANITMTFQS